MSQSLRKPEEKTPPPIQRNDECVLILTHKFDQKVLSLCEDILTNFENGYDIFLLVTEKIEIPPSLDGKIGVKFFDAGDIFVRNYGRKSESLKMIPGNADLPLLAFSRLRPDYKYYWCVEFDVWFQNGASNLFQVSQKSDADLLVPFLWTKERKPDWYHWNGLRRGELRPDGRLLGNTELMGCLLSLGRYSQRLMATVNWSYENGWAGHHEVTWPTIANSYGFKIEEINKVAKELNLPTQYDWLTYNTTSAGAQKSMNIYHPVKTQDGINSLNEAIKQLKMEERRPSIYPQSEAV